MTTYVIKSYGFKHGQTKQLYKDAIEYLMGQHIGKINAIPRNELRSMLKMPFKSDRAMRLLISELRHEGLPILFSTSKPSGYYLPANLAELKEGINKLRSYVIDECIVIRDLKVKGQQWINREGQGQLL